MSPEFEQKQQKHKNKNEKSRNKNWELFFCFFWFLLFSCFIFSFSSSPLPLFFLPVESPRILCLFSDRFIATAAFFPARRHPIQSTPPRIRPTQPARHLNFPRYRSQYLPRCLREANCQQLLPRNGECYAHTRKGQLPENSAFSLQTRQSPSSATRSWRRTSRPSPPATSLN